jgi:predicted DsbA family dithiol-disulfide isomerase
MDSTLIFNYAKANQIDKQISEFKGGLRIYSTNTIKGHEVLVERYKKSLVDNFVDSLKNLHKIEILLTEPKSPKIRINDLLVHYKGNLKSKVSFIVVSDFECDMCREYHPIFDSIFKKYKTVIKFGFVNYGSYVTPSALATECANNQGKFWNFHDSIFSLTRIPDTTRLFKIAKSLDLNMTKFNNDFFEGKLSNKIEKSLLDVRSAGIYGTPTILINDKIIFNSSSVNEIVKILEDEIKRND